MVVRRYPIRSRTAYQLQTLAILKVRRSALALERIVTSDEPRDVKKGNTQLVDPKRLAIQEPTQSQPNQTSDFETRLRVIKMGSRVEINLYPMAKNSRSEHGTLSFSVVQSLSEEP